MTAAGPLCKGPPGMYMKRWQLWLDKFRECEGVVGEDVYRDAKRAADHM